MKKINLTKHADIFKEVCEELGLDQVEVTAFAASLTGLNQEFREHDGKGYRVGVMAVREDQAIQFGCALPGDLYLPHSGIYAGCLKLAELYEKHKNVLPMRSRIDRVRKEYLDGWDKIYIYRLTTYKKALQHDNSREVGEN